MSLAYAKEMLKEVGKVIYQRFIPEDFSDILRAKFLFLEVEDPDIPWELMYDDDFFAVKYAVSRRIVTTGKVITRHISKKKGKKALVICDPTETLPGAKLECEIVYRRLKQKMETIFVEGHDAHGRRVANLFGQEFDIIHFAGHVENGLVLSDGVMTPEEVREYIVGTPVVVVNGCKSENLAKAFLLGGAMAYIGTIHPVYDRSAADIAANFYDLCFKYRISEALRRARELHMDKDLVWASLVMYGDPTLKLL
ncbi:MAG: CHAT domain-containing protein [Theionarchaea archaeon]|nr:CHAT domain-containing protein [Theionarchaea archaeon]